MRPPMPSASNSESPSSIVPAYRKVRQASRSGASTSDSGAQADTHQPVILDQWKACSERSPSKSVVVTTPSARLPYWRSHSPGTGWPT